MAGVTMPHFRSFYGSNGYLAGTTKFCNLNNGFVTFLLLSEDDTSGDEGGGSQCAASPSPDKNLPMRWVSVGRLFRGPGDIRDCPVPGNDPRNADIHGGSGHDSCRRLCARRTSFRHSGDVHRFLPKSRLSIRRQSVVVVDLRLSRTWDTSSRYLSCRDAHIRRRSASSTKSSSFAVRRPATKLDRSSIGGQSLA